MKIFTIEQQEYTGYDVYLGHVIIAGEKTEVIKCAQMIAADEGEECWLEADIKEIGEYSGESKEPLIVLSNFRAG